MFCAPEEVTCSYQRSGEAGRNGRLVGQLQGSALVLQDQGFTKVQKLVLNLNNWSLPNTGNEDLLKDDRRERRMNSQEEIENRSDPYVEPDTPA